MQLLFEIGPELRQAVSEMTDAGRNLRAAVSEGLGEAGQIIASAAQSEYLTGQYLKRRTGNLARAVTSWMADDLDCVIGVADNSAVEKYKWLLGDNPENQPVTIRPKNGKFLTIPIADNLTSVGVPRYNSPRDVPEDLKPFFFKSGGRLLFGYRPGKTERSRVRLLFTLVTEVQVYDTGALPDAGEENIDRVTDRINDKLEGLLN